MLKPNPFAGDDGSLLPSMAVALATSDPGERLVAVVAELRTGRVLVPVVAHSHPGTDGGEVAAHEKQISGDAQADATSSAASALLRTEDGRAALPVFSSYDQLRAWRADARPVPVEGQRAAMSAAAEEDQLMVLDPAGETPVLIGRVAVGALATDSDWTPPWVDQDLPVLITRSLRGSKHLIGVALEPGRKAELKVVLAVRAGFDLQGLEEELARVSARLGEIEELRTRVDSIELFPTLVAE
jgi:hypothetical protein